MTLDDFQITPARLNDINSFITDPNNPLMLDLLQIVEKYGGVEEINRKCREAGKVENLMSKLEGKHPKHVEKLNWLMKQKETDAFISVDDFRGNVLGDQLDACKFDMCNAVTLEISACQYFDFFVKETEKAIQGQELMPGRFIRVRFMKEQEADGDLAAMQAAMKIIGSSVCETLDTKGTDGSNVHLGGPETITGYFGGVGQPNDYGLKWIDEFLYYYTNYGVKQVLNVNPGTVMLGYMLHKLGVDIEFKISVYMGNDNPYSVLWTLMTAKLLSRNDGTTPLIGFNFSNSVNNETIYASDKIRSAFGFTENVRFEHHITETWKSIVVQPYDRREELLELADKVPNVSAKHEGGDIEVEKKREKNEEHPSDILEYFIPREEVEAKGMMPLLTRNYLDKHDALNHTARALTEKGETFIAARELHH